MGEKPLYYGTMGGVFLFGSEIKALKAHPIITLRQTLLLMATPLRPVSSPTIGD
jgi:asparagine synthetase B (glutamine-hydrolysing)